MILSHPVQEIVKEAILQTNSTNRYELCLEIANILESRYCGGKLEYQSKRMYLGTTKQILEVIDSFFFRYLKLPITNIDEFDSFESDDDLDCLDESDFLDDLEF